MTPSRATFLLVLIASGAALAAGGTITGKVDATPAKYLTDTVVYLKEVPGDYKPTTHKMDQKGMKFIPRILIITAGDTVKFLNSDGVAHNVMSTDGEGYNLGMFPKGESRDQKFDKPGTYAQLCSVHPEMLAYVFVGQNPYAAAVDKQGNYTIKDVPPGNYQLAVWNPSLKAGEQAVAVEAGKTATMDFALAR
jgi:plastocyanin